ncbi:[4Fe-4S] cluster assembly scaffold protein Mrp (=ApbC) [hydrothermal vent metagenome]|uniref:[4Fe-4S] cluster assembly scaffold protein Mrp (=ApbC) n=1 Tax=hydrothermal vent metagenome TaxID=652676 RepID=A0A3B1B2D6_9ZZZZ
MSEVTRKQVEEAIKSYIEPHLEKDLVSAKSIKNVTIDGGKVTVEVELGFPAKGIRISLGAALREKIEAVAGVASADVRIGWKITSHSVQKGLVPIKNVKNVIAVASGKGGVGKSTTAANMALALVAEGATVGVLDADIYGPSQPRMLGAKGRPESKDGKTIEPIESLGLQAMSIGFLVEEDTAMIWRGPMVTQALEQLLNDTNWRDLDYLIIDLPPGTGDAQLTLAQKVPVSGAVIVTTPQDIALLDARKGLKMFEKVEIPVLGIVENMSTHVCSKCGHEEHIFGKGGGVSMAQDFNIDLLGSLPLDIRIREETDGGVPTVAAEPDSSIALTYRDIARKTAAKLSLTARDYADAFPKIVIE